MNLYLKIFLTNLLLVLLFFSSSGQEKETDCLKKYQEAEELYNQGRIEEIPGKLRPCIEEGFTRNEKIEAYKLLILTYLFDGDQINAERTMIEFLKKYPEYEIMPKDPIEFKFLFESFHSLSVFSIGLTIGPNFSNPRIIEPFSTADLSTADVQNKTRTSIQFSLGGIRYLAKRLFLNLEIGYLRNSYLFTENIGLNSGLDNNLNTTLEFKESLSIIDVPISFCYVFELLKYDYYFRLGFSYGIVTKALGGPTVLFQNQLPLSSADIDISEYRKKSIYSIITGFGVKLKIPRGYLSTDIRFNIGLNNIVNENNKEDIENLIFNYYHTDSYYSVNRVSITLGYYFSIYRPKKNI